MRSQSLLDNGYIQEIKATIFLPEASTIPLFTFYPGHDHLRPHHFRFANQKAYSPFLLFFMKASSPPNFSSCSWACFFAASLTLGLDSVA